MVLEARNPKSKLWQDNDPSELHRGESFLGSSYIWWLARVLWHRLACSLAPRSPPPLWHGRPRDLSILEYPVLTSSRHWVLTTFNQRLNSLILWLMKVWANDFFHLLHYFLNLPTPPRCNNTVNKICESIVRFSKFCCVPHQPAGIILMNLCLIQAKTHIIRHEVPH